MLLWVDNGSQKEGHQFVQPHVSLDCWWCIQGLLTEDYKLSFQFSTSSRSINPPSVCSGNCLLQFFSPMHPHTSAHHHCPSPILTYWNRTSFSKSSLKTPFYQEAFFRSSFWKWVSFLYSHSTLCISPIFYVTALCTTILSSFNIVISFR